MTGKELIIYILNNHIEDQNVEAILNHAFLSPDEMAARFNVGTETVKVWYKLKLIKGFELNNKLYLAFDNTDPRNKR